MSDDFPLQQFKSYYQSNQMELREKNIPRPSIKSLFATFSRIYSQQYHSQIQSIYPPFQIIAIQSQRSPEQQFLCIYNLQITSLICQQQMQKGQRKQQFAVQFEQSEANYSEINRGDDGGDTEGRPLQLLRIRPNGKIEIVSEAISAIASVDGPIGFVSLVGKTRTGKSCLLNRLLHLTGDGFRVDPSTSSCTEGIWMWSQPFFNQQYNCNIFFLDTQGTDSLVKDADNDAKIFTLAVLLSTYFIYNSVGTINEIALSELEMVTALSKNIKTGGERGVSQDTELHKYMPKFLWLLRDFMLKIEDERGRKISPSQYLENCLNDKDAIGKTSEQSRKIKRSIMNYFPDRGCLTLIRPVDDEEQLQRLNQLPDFSLRPEFTKGINELREKIMANTGPKIYEGKPIDGYGMASMIQSYVQSFNSGQVPNVKTAWQQIAKDQGLNAYTQAINKYQQIFNEQFPDQQPKDEQIYNILSKMETETLRFYQSLTVNNPSEEHAQQLHKFLKSQKQSIIQQNNIKNDQRNKNLIYQHSNKLKKRILQNYYTANKKNMQQFKVDIEQVINNYNKQARGGRKGDYIAEFMKQITPLSLNMKVNNTEEQEQLRLKEIQIREQNAKLERMEKEQKSKSRQVESEGNAAKLKAESEAKRQSKKEVENREKGCCGGGGCEIM